MFLLLLANSYERDMVSFNEVLLEKGQRIFGSCKKKKEELISENIWKEKKQENLVN